MIDKFECEYLDVLTGICSQTGKGVIRGDGGCVCDSCQYNSGCTCCKFRSHYSCITGDTCMRDDSI